MVTVFDADLGSSFESALLILAALFLWITWIFAERSVKDIAETTSFSFLLFFAIRIAISRRADISLLFTAFLFEPRRALFAVFVTGIP